MKNLQGLVAAVIITCLLTACHSSYITKRRYNKGYYVEHSRHQHDKQNKQSGTAQKEPVRFAKIEEQAVPAQPVAQPAPSRVLTAEKTNQAAAVKASKSSKPAAPAAVSFKQPIKSIEHLSKRLGSAATSGDALSLLWIVIIVILILYVIGLVADIGPAIHVLAIIALVLLILWLLRIL